VACHSHAREDAFLATACRWPPRLRPPAADGMRLPWRMPEPAGSGPGHRPQLHPAHDTMTIAEILPGPGRTTRGNSARVAENDRRCRRAAPRIQQLLDSLVAVMVVDKSFLPEEPGPGALPGLHLPDVRVQEPGTKSIQAFQGDVSFSTHGRHDLQRASQGGRSHRPGKDAARAGTDHPVRPVPPGHQRLRSTPLVN